MLGLLAGLFAAWTLNRLLESQLVGVSPHDAITMAVAPLVLVFVALIACALPSRRAVRVDPATALRHQ